MKRFLSSRLSARARLVSLASVAGVLLVATACNDSPSSPSGSGGCEVITGNTTTTFSAAGGSGSISIRTTSSCTWGAVSSQPFLTITQGASGAGDGSVAFSVAPNSGPQRTAVITVTDTNAAFAD